MCLFLLCGFLLPLFHCYVIPHFPVSHRIQAIINAWPYNLITVASKQLSLTILPQLKLSTSCKHVHSTDSQPLNICEEVTTLSIKAQHLSEVQL